MLPNSGKGGVQNNKPNTAYSLAPSNPRKEDSSKKETILFNQTSRLLLPPLRHQSRFFPQARNSLAQSPSSSSTPPIPHERIHARNPSRPATISPSTSARAGKLSSSFGSVFSAPIPGFGVFPPCGVSPCVVARESLAGAVPGGEGEGEGKEAEAPVPVLQAEERDREAAAAAEEEEEEEEEDSDWAEIAHILSLPMTSLPLHTSSTSTNYPPTATTTANPTPFSSSSSPAPVPAPSSPPHDPISLFFAFYGRACTESDLRVGLDTYPALRGERTFAESVRIVHEEHMFGEREGRGMQNAREAWDAWNRVGV